MRSGRFRSIAKCSSFANTDYREKPGQWIALLHAENTGHEIICTKPVGRAFSLHGGIRDRR